MRGIETQNTPGGLLPPIKREDYMQYMMQNRVTHTQAADFQTPYIDVSDSPLLTLNAIVYSNGGTSPVASVTLQTSDDLETSAHALELTYQGSYELDDAALSNGSALDEAFHAIGGWIAAALVQLGDLGLR